MLTAASERRRPTVFLRMSHLPEGNSRHVRAAIHALRRKLSARGKLLPALTLSTWMSSEVSGPPQRERHRMQPNRHLR